MRKWKFLLQEKKKKKGENEGAFPFLLVYCQHWLPSPILQTL